MTKLNKGTERAQGFVNSYNHALRNHGRRNVSEAYGKPSQRKLDAWKYCVNLCNERSKGENLTVVGKTCHIFTAGFTFAEGGKRYLCYITPSNDFQIELD